jgi:hypothetical protein
VILTISPKSVPQAYIAAHDVAPVLGVPVEQVNDWCRSGLLPGQLIERRWWVTEGQLERFVEGCTWRLDAPPPAPPCQSLQPGAAARCATLRPQPSKEIPKSCPGVTSGVGRQRSEQQS